MTRRWTVRGYGGPSLTLEVHREHLRAWVHLERALGVWATQELGEHPSGGWRPHGEVSWSDADGRQVDVATRVSARPGIDSCLPKLGRLLSSSEPALPQWVRDAMKASDFAPRTARGRDRERTAKEESAAQADRRRLSRAGRTKPSEWPPLERMAPLGRSEQLDELRRAGLSKIERDEWFAMHTANCPVSLRRTLIAASADALEAERVLGGLG